jgi:Mg-chelatase subunit ChlD
VKKEPVITIILDRSGSMGSVQEETVKGINKFLKEQVKGAKVSLHQFDYNDKVDIEATFEDALASEVKLRSSQYRPRGLTPLLDAVGTVVSGIKSRGDHIVLIVTDGMENQSKDWTRQRVKNLIEKKRKAGWQFVFMGAAIDAYGEASSLGIPHMNTYAYAATPQSTTAAWGNASVGTRSYSTGMTNTVTMPDFDTEDPTYHPPTTAVRP